MDAIPQNKGRGETAYWNEPQRKLRLRRIGYCVPEIAKHYVFLTNHFTLSAVTIAKIYKSRWQIELFFK